MKPEAVNNIMNEYHVSYQEAEEMLEQEKTQKTTPQKQTITSEESAKNTKTTLDLLSYQAMQNNYLVKAGAENPSADSSVTLPTWTMPLAHQIDKKDAQSLLTNIWWLNGDYIDESKMDVKKNSAGEITDIYYDGVRYGIRYDANGNITKTIRQCFDEQGRINYQQVDNWADGDIKQQTSYNYEYDENGERIQTSREAHDTEFGGYNTLLEKYFGIPADPCGMHHSLWPISNIQKTQDGKITEFTDARGTRYCLRYDENGNLTKTFTQEFDDEGRIVQQDIKTYSEDGRLNIINKYTYDENGNCIKHETEIEVPPVPCD